MGLLNHDQGSASLSNGEDGLTLDAIGVALGCSRERVRQLETQALLKLRLAFSLEEMLGPKRAAPLLAKLRGKSLGAFRDAYRAVKESA